MNPLEQRIAELERRLNMLEYSDRYIFQKNIQLMDGRKIQVGTVTGSTIGTAATQKLSVFGVAPVAQQTAITTPNAPGSSYNQTDAQTAVTAIIQLATRVKNFGITT